VINLHKVFLYLYPIKEYMEMFLFHDDELYDKRNIERPLPILNECIQKRYRDNGYKIVFALYPDKEIFGITPKMEDSIIYTDIYFKDVNAYTEDGNIKKNFIPKYPNEELLLKQLGSISKLVIGGFHANDCVKRVAETALTLGIDTIIDLDMTDLFFGLYKQKDYFRIEEYSPEKYKEHIINQAKKYNNHYDEKIFDEAYSSLAFGFDKVSKKR